MVRRSAPPEATAWLPASHGRTPDGISVLMHPCLLRALQCTELLAVESMCRAVHHRTPGDLLYQSVTQRSWPVKRPGCCVQGRRRPQ